MIETKYSVRHFFFKLCNLRILYQESVPYYKQKFPVEKISEGPKMDRKLLNYFSDFWLRYEIYGSKTGIKW